MENVHNFLHYEDVTILQADNRMVYSIDFVKNER